MKPSKGGVRSYYFVVLVSVFILFASNPLSAADSSTISQTTREDSTSSADSARDDSTGAGVKSNGVAGISRGSPESSISADSASANFAAPEGGSTAGGGAATSISNPTIDTFQFTGAAMAKVPIVVPPGRNRIQPNLNLIYNSFQKNGWIGVGWSLDVGSIQRSTRYGVDYQADDYVVVQERSSSELVERSDWGPGYFGAKIEGGFAKYQLNGDDGWEVTAKNGAKYFYGTAPASRQHDADDNSRIFKWCLDRVEDTNGNFMTFSYTKDQGEIYLDRIDYTGNVGRNPTNYVKFHLEPERRPDVSVMYDGNFRVTTAKRLRTIEVQGNGEIARAYTFTYKDNQNTFHSLLSFIEVYGSNAVIDDDGMVLSGTRLPRIGIEYQDSALGANDELWINRPVSSSNGPFESGYGDFNGDGKTDYAYRQKNTNQFHVMLSTGTSFVDELWINRPVSSSNGPFEGGYGDFNGDGKTDYAYRQKNTNQFHVMLSTGTSFVDELWINRPVSSSNGPYEGGYGDFNGDGKTDYAYRQQNTQKFRVMLSTGQIPDLVSEIDNGLGKKTTLSYTPSSEYQNERLPFIIQTVSSVTMDDGNPLGTQTTTAYKYSGGLFDLVSRELRGFETVTQTSAVGSPFEIITETKFHQDGFLKGRPDRIEVKLPEETGALLSKTIFSWDKEFLDPPEDSYAFVKLQQKLTESYDGVTVSSQEDFAYDDANGNLLSKTTSGTDGEDVTITYQYSNLGDWLWRKAQETLKNESQQVVREIYFQYWDDGTGNLRFKEFRLNGQANPKMEMTYDSYGNQKTVIDPRGYSTTTDYDTATRTYPVKITYPETGGVSHIVENEAWDYRFGKVIITKDENGNRTYYDYDEFGRPVQVDSPSGGQAITEYYDDVFPRFVVTKVKENASGSTIDSYQYFDGLGRVIQGITLGEAGKAIVTKLFYDELGRNDLVEGPFFEPSRDYVANPPTHSDYPLNPSGVCPWQQTSFDPRGRPVSIESADGEYGSVVATFSYSGLSATVIDPDEGSKTETKDYLGRIIQVIEHGDGAAYTTSYTYNAAGDLLTVNDHYKNTTTVNYDTLGRKLSMNDPDMGYWEYTYDPNGNLLTQTDEKLQTVTFAYDELNRVTSKTYSTSDPTVTYIYDNLTIANGRGRLRSVSNTQVTTTYNAYDEMGNVTSVSKTITGDATLYTTQYEYDLSGKVTKTIYPDGYHVSNAFYAGTGLLHAVTGSDAVEYARLSDYEPTGKIGLIEHANGILTSYTYDPESTRLTSIVTARPGPAIDLQNKTYRYTGAGDIKEIIDDVKSITYNYTYDRFHRLTGETNTGAYDPISYTYNATGNIMSKTVGSTTLAYTYDTWHKHAVKTINFSGNDHNYTYDDNGNMTAGPDFTDPLQVAARTIGYNADNMPTSISHVKGGHTVTTDFIYDGDGVRSKKIVEGSSTAYYIGAHFEIKDGVATKFIFAGNLRIAKAAASGTHYFHKDHLGSSTVMTDATGAAVETTDYMPFGSQRDPTGTDVSNYKFTDQEFDAESGLYNYNARLYDPIIGRFISADPFVQAPFDPQTLNRYSYCRNNPLIYIDPSGYGFFSDLWDKAKSFVKNATKFVASTITNTVLSNVIFSIWDVPFPGLGVAIRIGIAYASNFAGDQVAGAIENGGSSTNSGAGFNGGGNVSSSQFGNNSIGATIDGSVPYANYTQNYGGNFDYKSAYSANIVSQGHKCDSAFHEALNNIYRGVIKGAGHFFTDGSKAVKDASIATYDLALNGPPLAKTALWIAAATEAIPFAAAIGYYSVTVGYPSFMIAAGTKGGQYFLLNIVDALSPTPPITPGGGVIKYYEWMRRQGLW